MNQSALFKKKEHGVSKNKLPGVRAGESYAFELDKMPDYQNDLVVATEERLGPFVYDQEEDSETERVQVCYKRPF